MQELARSAENLAELVRRGAPVSRRSRLVGVRCVHCRCEYLYDEVLDRLLLDPVEPRLACGGADDQISPCRGCGRGDWEFEDVAADDETFFDGAWAYSFWQPVPREPRGRVVKVVSVVTAGTLALLGAAALAMNPDPFAAPGSARPTIDLSGR